MKEDRILDLLGEVDEKYIREADPEGQGMSKFFDWRKLAAIAVCLFLVLAVGRIAANLNLTGHSSNSILHLSVAAAELGMEEYMTGVSLPDIVYADAGKVIMYDFRGIYVYNIVKEELTGFSDFRPIDMTLIQGSDPTQVLADKDGKTVRFFNSEKKFVYDTEKNETLKVDEYEGQFDECNIQRLPYGDGDSISDVQLTYIGSNGNAVSLDLRYDGQDVVRYKDLVLLIKDKDKIREYEIFK